MLGGVRDTANWHREPPTWLRYVMQLIWPTQRRRRFSQTWQSQWRVKA